MRRWVASGGCQRGRDRGVPRRGYWSLARTAEAPLEHNFRYPRIRELTVDNDAIALGGQGALFLFFDRHLGIESYCY